jgi:UDPglucose 6-dehydrogenase
LPTDDAVGLNDTIAITVIGAGHVGLVTAACLAAIGHRVRVQDIDRARLRELRLGRVPFFEPGLEPLIAAGVESGRLSFHAEPAEALAQASVAFVCVNTPNGAAGVDLGAVLATVNSVTSYAPPGTLLVNRSTAPVGTGEYIRSIVQERRGTEVGVAVNPEFLAEGTAVADFLSPDRIVVGAWEEAWLQSLLKAYGPIIDRRLPSDLSTEVRGRLANRPEPVPVVATDPATAELAKYAANAFLAVKISFINEMACIAEEVGGDVTQVARAIGLDRRIGPHFLRAGIGWGGSCFPKDIIALRGMAETRGLEARMLQAANEVNDQQHRWVIRKLQRHLKTLVGRRIALLGLSFKPDTDDLRNAPSLDIAGELIRLNARVRAFDPFVTDLPAELTGVEIASDPLSLVREAEALVLVTEWREFGDLDLAKLRAAMARPLLLDGRNFLDPMAARAAGFTYVGVGRDGDSMSSIETDQELVDAAVVDGGRSG